MKLAIASIHDLNDVNRGSGTFYYMIQELERQGLSVVRLGPFALEVPFMPRLLNAIHRRIGKRHVLFLDPFVGNRTGIQVGQKLAGVDFDVLLTKDFCMAAFTPTAKPVVLYTDVMITPKYSEKDLPGCRLGNMSRVSLGLCRRTFRKALRRVALAAFPAEWSAQAARTYCNDPAKIKVIPFGANIADPGPGVAKGRSWERVRDKGCVDLLFVGKDWVLKGGNVAVDTVLSLNAQGLKTRLHVVGAKVPHEVDPEQVREYGLLDKSKPEEMSLLTRLYTESNAFILPSSREGFNNSMLMAAAFGLPTLAYDANGVRDAVGGGAGGVLLPLGARGEGFAQAILSWQASPSNYEALALGARRHYETKANWHTSVNTLVSCLEDILQKKNDKHALSPSVVVESA